MLERGQHERPDAHADQEEHRVRPARRARGESTSAVDSSPYLGADGVFLNEALGGERLGQRLELAIELLLLHVELLEQRRPNIRPVVSRLEELPEACARSVEREDPVRPQVDENDLVIEPSRGHLRAGLPARCHLRPMIRALGHRYRGAPTEGARISWLVEVGARLLLATRAVDSAWRLFDRARSELVATVASDALLRRFNELAYGSNREYRADAKQFRTYLFPWEEQVIAEFFPAPPARVLIGGAGGGREAFALARMGYRVVAFEPSAPLAATLAGGAPEGAEIEAHRGGYEDLPRLSPALPGGTADRLDRLEPFDASILGWGSFSHLMREDVRVRTLSAFAEATRGPILLSLLAVRDAPPGPPRRFARVRRSLPRRPGRSPDDLFSVHIGYFHRVDRHELARLAGSAGLEIRYLNFDERDTNWPHAVLVRADG